MAPIVFPPFPPLPTLRVESNNSQFELDPKAFTDLREYIAKSSNLPESYDAFSGRYPQDVMLDVLNGDDDLYNVSRP